MKKMLYIGALILITSCQKDPIYSSDRTLYDLVEIWEEDAIAHGLTIEQFEHIEVVLDDLPPGWGGAYGGNKIVLDIKRFKGSDRNINTLYHEFGHAFGLQHDVTPIMATYSTSQQYRLASNRDKDHYWSLINYNLTQKK